MGEQADVKEGLEVQKLQLELRFIKRNFLFPNHQFRRREE
jgi:hypothetical protein